MHLARFKRLTIAAALLAATGVWAQFDPAQVHPEPPPVHARFAAPAVPTQRLAPHRARRVCRRIRRR